MVHVNGKKVGGNDAVTKFTAYVSPYFVVSNGGAYTKHIYAASQRIASKLGNEDGFGADPRRVEQAGGLKISDSQKDNIGARYKELGFTYSAPEKEKVEKDSTMDSESEEKLIFFYHPDHLGSTSYVTDADGNIAQHVEYIPYGEVFVEERNSQFSTNFLFNAKELDNETGLYYYGARYLDPTSAMWLSVDPLFEKYAGMSPYNYCMGNPVVMVDVDGNAPWVLIAAGIGAVVNTGFAIYDNWDDPFSLSKVGKIGAAFCGGAVCGAVAACGGVFVEGSMAAGATFGTGTVVAISAGSSAIGGALGDATEQGINIAAGNQTNGYNVKKTVVATVVGGAVGAGSAKLQSVLTKKAAENLSKQNAVSIESKDELINEARQVYKDTYPFESSGNHATWKSEKDAYEKIAAEWGKAVGTRSYNDQVAKKAIGVSEAKSINDFVTGPAMKSIIEPASNVIQNKGNGAVNKQLE